MKGATPAVCRSCGAQIVWVLTDKKRSMPLDAEPNPDGNVLVVDGIARVSPQPEFGEEEDMRFMPHWATCPDADSFRQHR